MKPAVKWVAAPTRPAPTAPATTSPATTSPILAVDRPAGSSGVTRVVATSAQVDAMAAAEDGGLWLGTANGLFHVDQSVLGRR